jgi:spore coat polysaccharide biosynthesis predicted glycosyltransferase SpsG
LNLTIITDGNKKLGLGHIKRSQTLANSLIKDGHKVKLIVLSEFCTKDQFVLSDVIIDLPYDGDFLTERIDSKFKVIGLDYLGEANLDLVINVFDYGRYKGSNQINGLDYAIIREDILSLINVNSVKKENVLVMLGSYDLKNYAYEVISLINNKKIPISFVEKEKSINVSSFDFCSHYENPSNIAEIMSSCTWAISNGGSSMLELMALGKAVHVLPQTKAEKALAKQILRSGGLLGLEFPVSIPNLGKINKVGKIANTLIDGQGVKRIINLIRQVVN